MTLSPFIKKIIFVVDDEQDIRNILKINLESEGYDVREYASGNEALRALSGITPDLIILDVMMDGLNGYDLCRTIKGKEGYSEIPVIFLSAKSEEFDKVLGLELGGDDYITKPFSIKEVRSRVKAVIRRSLRHTNTGNEEKIFRYKGIELNSENYSLSVDGSDVALTKTEFGILYIFFKNPGKIFTRDNIIDSIRGQDVYVIDRTIDVHVMNLRKKLGPYKDVIKTFSGVGYGFKE
jgi:two-component system alkaline phosphatase synthesis response regulator PhoP